MDDKRLVGNLLLTAKGVCGLYLHDAVEPSATDMHQAFDNALNESLCLQNQIYKKMSAKGWYSTEQAEQQKITKVKNQFVSM